MIFEYQTPSDFVAKAIPSLFPNGYCTVINCWFSTWEPWRDEEGFEKWAKGRIDKLIKDHPLREQFAMLRFGECLIFHSDSYDESYEVYEIFSDPDKYYVTFYENGKLTNENT